MEDKRICNECCKQMNKGYCVRGGEEYYCCANACINTIQKKNGTNCMKIQKKLIGQSGRNKDEIRRSI